MTEALRRVVSEIESLPDEEQDRIAMLLQAELDRRWDEALESPRSVRILDEMAERVREERRAGQTRGFPS
jgi:predicted lipid-binding transport protein (Tim44 family)